VGQVLARHLVLGGARVTFFVRDKYREATLRGFDLCQLRAGWGNAALVRFDAFDVVTRASDVRGEEFEQAYLAVPSSALAGPWLGELAAALGEATVVSFQAGSSDRAKIVAGGVAAERLVFGFIGFFSYQAPLPGERASTKPATAYWLPALSPTSFEGPDQRSGDVVSALRRGRLPARRRADLSAAVAFPTAIVMSYLLTLESVEWSLPRFTEERYLRLAASGARAASAIVELDYGRAPLAARLLAKPRCFVLFLRLARWLVPFPLEAYLRAHFTKVRAQTRTIVQSLIDRGKSESLDVRALEQAMAEVAPKPSPNEASDVSPSGDR
jgi:2-dehydropantoate 2-reductase